jgi:uncharacterized protein (TIGR02246 family)
MHDDEAQIREVIAEQVAAMRTADAKSLVGRFAPDAVVFDLAPPLRHTGAEVTEPAGLEAWLTGFDNRVDFDVRDLTVAVDGDVAFCHSLNRMATTPHGSPEGFELWFRSTVCLRRIHGRWLVVHEHTSTPFDMDGSFRASVELKP